MDHSIKSTIERSAADTHAGRSTFGEGVALLKAAGVEAYHADFRRREATYYLPSGEWHAVPLPAPEIAVPQAFDAAALQAAIRGAQRDELRYPEFMQLAMAAGCVGYFVWIAGHHVEYFSHRGQGHIERFPDAMD
ncbi:Phage envelope protein [Variovorax sp. SRS16]|uniref:DUF1398 domain-containing protein n=1 Tax=Variovorax sp. SRS16 TaxID=282217 RepID=UPI0013163E02|nr:DUF1398 domain-containing protein [Variovorax sp. SRS16]VTU16753.1 Phage envelope protein [Variovorax sp. SRS16]